MAFYQMSMNTDSWTARVVCLYSVNCETIRFQKYLTRTVLTATFAFELHSDMSKSFESSITSKWIGLNYLNLVLNLSEVLRKTFFSLARSLAAIHFQSLILYISLNTYQINISYANEPNSFKHISEYIVKHNSISRYAFIMKKVWPIYFLYWIVATCKLWIKCWANNKA